MEKLSASALRAVASHDSVYGADGASRVLTQWINKSPRNLQKVKKFLERHGCVSVTAFVGGILYSQLRKTFLNQIVTYGPDKASKAITAWLDKGEFNLGTLKQYLRKENLGPVTVFMNAAEFASERRQFIAQVISER